MRKALLCLTAAGIAGLAVSATTPARAAFLAAPQAGDPSVQRVWYDLRGRWHPPAPYFYRYGPGPHGPPGPPYWRRRQIQCLRWGAC